MATWSDLEDELDRWRAAQLVPTLWWRDDDAHAATRELEPLLELSESHRVPVHLAVIPDLTHADLAERLISCRFAYLLQHGFAHTNHEPSGLGASEFGDHRDIEMQRRDLRKGWLSCQSATSQSVTRCGTTMEPNVGCNTGRASGPRLSVHFGF